MITDERGESRVELSGVVKSPEAWVSGGIVGMAWNFPFETDRKENE